MGTAVTSSWSHISFNDPSRHVLGDYGVVTVDVGMVAVVDDAGYTLDAGMAFDAEAQAIMHDDEDRPALPLISDDIGSNRMKRAAA